MAQQVGHQAVYPFSAVSNESTCSLSEPIHEYNTQPQLQED